MVHQARHRAAAKTNVMAMLIAWQVINKVIAPQDTRFSKNVLVVAPRIDCSATGYLYSFPARRANFYDDLPSPATPSLREQFRQGKVKVINGHKLDWDSEEQLAKRKSVVKAGTDQR